MAGSDTTVTSIRSALLFIITHPQVHATLRAELDDAYSRGEFDDPVISDSQALRLPYFQACIRESLRMIPPVFGMLQKLVPPEGDTIDGKYLPPGTRVGTCIYGILRNKKTFGDDADLYRPERWLREDDARLSQMIKAGEIMFGSGKYSCLGKTVAMFEIRKTIATVSNHFGLDICISDQNHFSVNSAL
jgi:cytochrome P450